MCIPFCITLPPHPSHPHRTATPYQSKRVEGSEDTGLQNGKCWGWPHPRNLTYCTAAAFPFPNAAPAQAK